MLTTVTVLALTGSAFAQHEHGDIALTGERGVIETGEIVGGVPVFGERVFETEFGKLPDWTDEPGFDSEVGAFAPRTAIGFDVNGPMLVWDGSAFTDVATPLLRITAGADVIDTGDGPVPGFVFGQASTTGRFHHHLGFELLAPATAGVYLLELTLWEEGGTLGDSEPLYIVMGQMAEEPDIDAAVDWVREELVGEGCPADFDGDGALTIFDFLAFQNAFDAGDPAADFDGDGALTIFDFLAFQNRFDAGCA
jgi:hypothetical protein